jgi:hypothetical protein
MNVWYTAAITGLVLGLEGLVFLIVNVIKKRERLSYAIRASSGGATLLLALLAIHFNLWRADIVVAGFNPLYSLASVGFVIELASGFSAMANSAMKRIREAEIDRNRAYFGIALFLISTIILVITGG